MRTAFLILIGAAIGAALGAMLPTRGLVTGKLFWPAPLCLLFGCAATPASICPDPVVMEISCPPVSDISQEFLDELNYERIALPSGSAIGKAARSYAALARKCNGA